MVQTGRIGDTILTTPMFPALKAAFPGALLHVLASAKGFSVLSHDPHVSKILVRHQGLPGLMLAALKARQEGYDLWIDPKDHASSESSFLARSSGAKQKIGFNGPGRVFDVSIPSDQDNLKLHAVDRNFQALASLEIPAGLRRPELYPEAGAAAEVDRALAGDAGPLAVVNISAGQPSRSWEEQSWSRVMDHLRTRGFKVALAFQPADAARAENFCRLVPGVMAIPSPTVHTAVALVRKARLVVTVDTAVVHMASAFDIPVVALYPDVDWNTRKFAPLSSLQKVVVSKDPGSLAGIPAEIVLKKIAEIIDQGGLV